MFDWSEKFETKIDIVDEQHQKLVALLNKMYESLDSPFLREEKLDKLLKQLLQYANKHFVDEEMLMIKNKVDERHHSVHRMEHQSFIYDVERLRSHNSLDENILEQTEKLVQFVTFWLTYHILGIDMEMARQIKEIKQGKSPKEAFDEAKKTQYDLETTHKLLDSVMDMWRKTTDKCYKLEEKLAALSKG